MSQPLPTPAGTFPYSRYWLWGFVLLLAVSLLAGLNAWGPLESSEARYAEIGREMLASHDWLHPRLLGIGHFHKPPFTYWLTAAGLALAGPTALGVRLLPVLAVLAQVLLVYGLGKLFFGGDQTRARTAAIIYGTLPVVLVSALNVTTDAYLATLELAAAYGILRHYHDGRWWGLYLFWLALGLAFLTKGPVGFVLPLMAVVGHYFRRGQAPRPFTRHHALGIGLFILVGLSWYLLLLRENPAFLRYFVIGHTLDRFAHAEAFDRAKPWWFYLVLAPATSLPWAALFIVQAIRTGWARLPQIWRNVLVFWVLVPLVFFSLSQSKLLLYVLPMFPGVALLTAYYLHVLPETAAHRWYHGFVTLWVLLLLALAGLPAVAELLQLTLAPAAALLPLAGLVVLTLSAWRSRKLPSAIRLLPVAAVFTATLVLAAKPVFQQNEAKFHGTRPVAALLQEHGLADRPVLVYNELLPSLAFAQGRVPISLYAGNHYLRRETQFERDSRWRQTNLSAIDMPPARLDSLLRLRPVLLVRDEAAVGENWLGQRFSHHLDLPPWRVYYDW
ncbi:ArnT family glycosyltransferase [Hymenobacter canadensis]|uniref:Glycosyltransferase family 39 protein n=1 Tax=Hymenobacter canadensis TaxID=2999067 RepID=A0ABY7LNU7_9BACT|nr:glycosyltransferase family 39 protein [Hymenobacter canadensis]WBA42088.1 glycosyltransferase family 39 protein [Hymenobacter canadensis]